MTATDLREADVLEAMRDHKSLGDALKELTRQRELCGAPIRAWLDANGPLRDGETGLEARYQERAGPPALDLSSMSDADVLAAARGGLLRAVDGGAAKAIGKKATERALEYIIEAWWKKVPEVIDECFARSRGDFEGDRLAKRIHRYVIRHGGVCTWAEVMRGCALKGDEVRKAINSLEEAQMVKLGEGADGTISVTALRPETEVSAATASPKKASKASKKSKE